MARNRQTGKPTGNKVRADRRLVKALSHPLRVDTLTILNEREASPNEIATELGEPLGNVSYHVKTLLENECIELTRTAPRRGALEHFYRATVPPLPANEEWDRLPASLKPSLSATLLEALIKDAVAALRVGALDARAERQLIRASLRLDEQGWIDIAKAIEATQEWIADIERESAERLETGQGEGLPATVSLLAYEAVDWNAAED